MRPLSLLLVAYQCGPGMGSVSQIGWEWFSQLRSQCDLTLVTHERNRAALAQAGGAGRIEYIDTEWFAGPLYRLARRCFPMSEHGVFLIASLDYFLFDLVAYWRLKNAIKSGATWQMVHRVTPVTLAAPTWLGRLGLPLVVGPLNCALGTPPGFAELLRHESLWLAGLRRIGHAFDCVIGSLRRSARILTATRVTFEAVAARDRGRCTMMLENGVHADQFRASNWPPSPSSGVPLRVLFVGRLIALKGVAMLLRAVAQLRSSGYAVELDIVGAGPMLAQWQALADTLRVADAVRFCGALDRADVARKMAACHVLCLPSVRESGGAVLLEAMACARPVIALAYGGPADIVDDSVGALLAIDSPEQVVRDLVACLRTVIEQPDQWRKRGLAGRARAERCYSWQSKLDTAIALYRQLIEEGGRHV